ncbi:MADS-box transcription factor family protein [Rhynchospora pubera]|uniref:MADS-box transcription factor family protein n=1 Tax=Rhynchospora pubera TaxID=906938 RepID=A0AAV8DH82_9POAL|nr:MADS-box transcription factor family protein [Rhynchospora pubera]
MGRNKIEIETKKTAYERKNTFGKRKNGLKKKARELSTLCDAPVMVLFSSPVNEKSYELFLGEQCNFEEMIQRYAGISSAKRYESKVEAFEELKKSFAKQGKVIDVNHELKKLHGEQSAIEDVHNNLCKLQTEIEEAEKALGVLRYVDHIDNICDMNMLNAMEATLLAALSHNSICKEEFLKQLSETANLNQFNEIPSASQVNHQLQSHGLLQVASNDHDHFQVNSAAGTSYQNSMTNTSYQDSMTNTSYQDSMTNSSVTCHLPKRNTTG